MVTVTPALASDGHRIGTNNFTNATKVYFGSNVKGMFRFGPVNVPQGATINSAVLTLNGVGGTGSNGDIYCEDTDDAAAIGTRDPTTLTTASTPVPATPSGIFTLNVASQVQEIVSRTGWTASNNMMFVIPTTTGTRYGSIEAEDAAGTDEASLVIDYSVGGGGGGGTDVGESGGILTHHVVATRPNVNIVL